MASLLAQVLEQAGSGSGAPAPAGEASPPAVPQSRRGSVFGAVGSRRGSVGNGLGGLSLVLGDGGRDGGRDGADGADGADGGVGSELLMTAAKDGCIRLWTLRGEHIGTFAHDSWCVGDSASYGPTPHSALREPPRTWIAPPMGGAEVPPRPILGRLGGSSGRSGGGCCGGSGGSGGSSAFLTSLDALDEPSEDSPVVRHAALGLIRAGRRRTAQAEAETSREAELRRTDNDERTREQLLAGRANAAVHSALSAAQATSAVGPLGLGLLRPSSAALRQAASMPILPPLREGGRRGGGGGGGGPLVPVIDEETARRRAEERARAQLRGRFREYQSEQVGVLGRNPTVSTDVFLVQREESRARRGQVREQLPVYDLGVVMRRSKSERKTSSLQFMTKSK